MLFEQATSLVFLLVDRVPGQIHELLGNHLRLWLLVGAYNKEGARGRLT